MKLSVQDRVLIRGAALPSNAVVDSCRVSLTTSENSQVDLGFLDDGHVLARAGWAPKGTPVDFDDLRMRVAAVSVGPGPAGAGGINLACRPQTVRTLSDRKGPLRLTGVSAAQFVEAECAAAGIKAVAEPGATLPEVVRDSEEPEDSSWSTFTRLAREVGANVFETAGTVYFGRPSWLVNRNLESRVDVIWDVDADDSRRPLEPPDCRQSEDADDDKTVTVRLPILRAATVRPGMVLRLAAYVPLWHGDYLIDSVNFDADAADGTVTASVAKDPAPQPPATVAEISGGTAGSQRQVRAEDGSLVNADFYDTGGGGAGSPSPLARSEIPAGYLPLYQAAVTVKAPTMHWSTLAAVGWVESRHGANMGPSSAGARGPMQFLPGTFREYGMDGGGDGRADIMDPADAIYSAANYLNRLGAATDLRKALASYNAGPGNWRAGLGYADKVLAKAAAYRQT